MPAAAVVRPGSTTVQLEPETQRFVGRQEVPELKEPKEAPFQKLASGSSMAI